MGVNLNHWMDQIFNYIKQNPEPFRGKQAGDVIVTLKSVNPNLYDAFMRSYGDEVEAYQSEGDIVKRLNSDKNLSNQIQSVIPPVQQHQMQQVETQSNTQTVPQETKQTPLQDLIYGMQPQEYVEIFRSALGDLNQPKENLNKDVAYSATLQLARSFIERYQEQTGKQPTANEVKDFVARNLNKNYAKQIITGEINPEIEKAKLVSPYLENTLGILPKEQAEQAKASSLAQQGKLESLFDVVESAEMNKLNMLFGEDRSRKINELASLGLLRSPIGYGQLEKTDQAKSAAISNLISQLGQQKIAGQIDLDKFGRNYDLAKEELRFRKSSSIEEAERQSDQFEKSLQLQKLLGKKTPYKEEPTWLDYVDTGVKAGGTLASLMNLFGGKKKKKEEEEV